MIVYTRRFWGVICLVVCSLGARAQNGNAREAASHFRVPPVPQFKKDTFRISRYGAKANGITLNTSAFEQAIDACSKGGGGVVLVERGLWLTGPIQLKSGVNLHVGRDAVLLFTNDFNQFKLVESNYEGLPAYRNQSPISGRNLENIAITGSGIVDGNGDAWRAVKREKTTESQWNNLVASGGFVSADQKTWYPTAKSQKGVTVKLPGVITPGKTEKDFEDIKDFLRPNLLSLTSCKGVLLDGPTFQNSPAWCLHPLMCENLTVRNVYAKNPWYAQNGDGIDLESCKNVLIENSTFDVGDDGICIKSGRDEEGRKRGMPTENVLVRNNVVYHAHGGFVIGSEMSGGARNIWVYDCSFLGTDVGLRFKTTRGRGGVVEKIWVSDINMKDIAGEAVLFDMYYAAKDPVPLAGEKREAPKVETFPVTEATPQFRDFWISNIACNGAGEGIFVRGLPEMNIKNINLENLTLRVKKGADIIEGTGINLKNVNLITNGNNPVFNVENSRQLTLDGIRYNDRTETLFSINGDKTAGITVLNTDLSKAKNKTSFNRGASAASIQIK
ncbi:MAG: glycoside hydrolase family 28 protein [Williamsia sp.]|nr:glycoside hydrolase family 28 protein [Williamsia sp.]